MTIRLLDRKGSEHRVAVNKVYRSKRLMHTLFTLPGGKVLTPYEFKARGWRYASMNELFKETYGFPDSLVKSVTEQSWLMKKLARYGGPY